MKQVKKSINYFLIFMGLYFFNPLHSVVAGSDQSVSIQSATTFPAADIDNEMRGFGWFKNGFSLENASTNCLFNSVYPLSGTINMNGGTITLAQDMIFKDIIFVGSFGTFIGNNKNIDFTQAKLVGLTPPAGTFQDVTVYTGADFFVANAFTFAGTCLVDGGNKHLSFLGPLAEIIIQPNSTLTLTNMSLNFIQDTNIRCVDDSAQLVLNNVSIELSDDFSFSSGSIQFLNYVDFQGSHTFIYDSTQSSTIASKTILKIFEDAYFQTGRVNDQTMVEPLVFTDQTSVLNLDTGHLIINTHGAHFLKGSLQVTNNVTMDALGSSTATALVFGDGNVANDFYFILDSGSFYETSGFQVLNDIQPNILLSKVGGAVISSPPGSTTYINQNQTITNLILKANEGTQTIVAPGKTLSFNDLTIRTMLGDYTITGNFVDANTNSLNGGQTITLNGALPSATLIANAGNFIYGSGQILAPIILQNSAAQLIWGNSEQLSADLFLNNGTVVLTSDMSLGHAIAINGPGNMLINNQNLNIGYVDYDQGTSWNSDLAFEGSVGVINFNAGITLSATWTVSGDVVLVGNNNTLDLTDGQIIVQSGTRLEFRNLNVTGIHGNNIRCLDGNGVWIVNNSSLFLSNDFTFNQGAIRWQNNILLQGNSTFIYESVQTSTLLSHSNMTLSSNFTFSYDTSSPDLWEFEDNTSQLIMNGGELFAAGQGLNLINGSLIVQASGGAFDSDTGITLGNCVAQNDFITTIASGAEFVIEAGALNFKNVLSTSWMMVSGSSLLTIGDNTSLNLYEDMNNGMALTNFGLNSTLGRSPGKNLNGSISGSPAFTVLPPCS